MSNLYFYVWMFGVLMMFFELLRVQKPATYSDIFFSALFSLLWPVTIIHLLFRVSRRN